MNLINLTVQGNLVRDANYSFFGEKERAVINFVIAVNLPSKKEEKKVTYIECSYWFNQKENEENKKKDFLIKNLKKGAGVVVNSEYIEAKHNVSEKTGVIYDCIAISVQKIIFTSLDKKEENIGNTAENIENIFPQKSDIEDDIPF